MSRGNRGQDVFLNDADRRWFLKKLTNLRKRSDFRLFAFCLMTNHFHLLIQVQRVPLSAIMQRLLTGYARHFNHQRKKSGHLFGARYTAVQCKNDSQLSAMLRYIHLNPVRAGLVEDPAQWPWSSHGEFVGSNHVPVHVEWEMPLSVFHPDLAAARRAYDLFVQGALKGAQEDAVVAPQINELPLLNSRPAGLDRQVRAGGDLPGGGTRNLDDLCQEIAVSAGLTVEAIKGESRCRKISVARQILVRRAVGCGYRPSRIAAFLGRSDSFVAKVLWRIGQ